MLTTGTKLNLASIASIILLIAYSAVATAHLIVQGGSPVEVCGNVASLLFVTDLAIIIILHKLGLWHSRYHVIACWAGLALWAVFLPTQIVLAHRSSDYLSLVLNGFLSLICILTAAMVCRMKVVVTAPSSSANHNSTVQGQQPFLPSDYPGSIIWVVFGVVVVMLILSVLIAFTDDNSTVVTLSAIQSIILALLAGSTWIVATTPSIADGIAEPLAPQEDTAARTNQGDIA